MLLILSVPVGIIIVMFNVNEFKKITLLNSLALGSYGIYFIWVYNGR